jgi:hypothetical protein
MRQTYYRVYNPKNDGELNEGISNKSGNEEKLQTI